MNRFQFRLENILRLRAAEETKKKREFGISLQHVQNAEERCRIVRNEISELDRVSEEKAAGNLVLEDMKIRHRYVRHLDRIVAAREKELEQARKVLDKKRSELVEATRRKKTLERLRERAHEEYQDEALKEEQNILDDLTAIKYKADDR